MKLAQCVMMGSLFQINTIDPLENQLCRVCEEKAAGFHFGAFTCEGCKSFFGRFCNNQTTIPDCKNAYRCVVDKRNRTSCKACRLRKCLAVGMSKSGCRYGRRSNWFKIHCLMQKNAHRVGQQQKAAAAMRAGGPQPGSGLLMPAAALPPSCASLFQSAQSSASSPSSRSPSPLNTSTESTSSSSSHQSIPSPRSAASSPESALFPANSTPLHVQPSVYAPMPFPAFPQFPLLDPLALYRLSPLLALSPYLPHATTSDFQEQLRLLSERRALFEASCSLARAGEEAGKPMDLSVK